MSPSCISSCETSAKRPSVSRSSSTHRVRVIRRLHPLAVEQEADAGHVLALAIAEGVHQLAQLGCALDLEKDLVVVIRDLDVEVLLLSVLGLLLHGGTVVRHVEGVRWGAGGFLG